MRAENGGLKINGWTATLLGGLALVAITYFVTKFTDNIGEQQKQNDDIATLKETVKEFKQDHDVVTSLKTTVDAMAKDVSESKATSGRMEKDINDLQRALAAHEQHSKLRSDHMLLPPFPAIHEHKNVKVIQSVGKWTYWMWIPREDTPDVLDKKKVDICKDAPEPEFSGGQILDVFRYRILPGCYSLNVPLPAYIIARHQDTTPKRWSPDARDLVQVSTEKRQ